MNTLMLLGKIIKERRLALNMRMEDLARKANISRATLWSIEKGEGNCSIKVIDTIFDILGLSFDIKTLPEPELKRERAPRINSKLDKKVNRFVIMCIEQYAHEKNISSKEAYELMFTNKVIDELISDYDDLHGMSTVYINEYISALVGDRP